MIQLPQAEIDLIDHCSLRCAHCASASPYMSPRIYDLEQFKKDIGALGSVAHLSHMQFIGGEPFLVPNFAEYAQVIRSNHLTDTLSVITNGLHLETVDEAAIASVDFVNVTYYVDLPTSMLERVDRGIERARTMHGRILKTQPKIEFMSTEFHGCLDEPTLQRVWAECWQKNICTSICDGYIYRCTMGQRRQRYFERIGHKFDKLLLAREVNGCIIDAPNLEERLGRYMRSEIPPPMCVYCIGCSGKIVTQRQMTVEEVKNPVLNTDASTLLL